MVCPHAAMGMAGRSVDELITQGRSNGNISSRRRRRREPLGGSESMLPQKILKSKGLEMLFPCDLRISRIIYFVRCLGKPMHIESITLETSITKYKTDYLCILKPANLSHFQSHHSKFVVIKLSELP